MAEKLSGIGDEAIGHMKRLEAAVRGEEVLIVKQTLEVVCGEPSIPTPYYGMSSGGWPERPRRRLVIEWDEMS